MREPKDCAPGENTPGASPHWLYEDPGARSGTYSSNVRALVCVSPIIWFWSWFEREWYRPYGRGDGIEKMPVADGYRKGWRYLGPADCRLHGWYPDHYVRFGENYPHMARPL